MSHTPHELSEEFPDMVGQMHALKASDAHFAKLHDEYHELNRAIHRAETNVEPMEDLAEGELEKAQEEKKWILELI